jgi:hypothetical protein
MAIEGGGTEDEKPHGMSDEARAAIGKFLSLMFRENKITAVPGMEFEFRCRVTPSPGGRFLLTDLNLSESVSRLVREH